MAKLEFRQISKSFGPTRVLDGITFDAHSGEVIALLGENGAGKSTLMKILNGVWPKGSYEGSIYFDPETKGKGRSEFLFKDTRDSIRAGIAMIHQEISLIPELTVAENLELGRLPGIINWKELLSRVQTSIDALGFKISAQSKVKDLSIGQRQLVEISRALTLEAQIIAFDEPTSALSETEATQLFEVIAKLKAAGKIIFYITHRMEEIFKIADLVVVLRDGKNAGEFSLAAQSPDQSRAELRAALEPQMIHAMVGRELDAIFPQKILPNFSFVEDRNFFKVEGISLTESSGKPRLQPTTFSVGRGEILGIGGLMGAGRSELLNAIFGLYHRDSPSPSKYQVKGNLELEGRPLPIRRPLDAINAGLALVSEDRKANGLILGQDLAFNIALPSLAKSTVSDTVKSGSEALRTVSNTVERTAETWRKELKIKSAGVNQVTRELSGGNQQKVIFAKWLEVRPKVLLLDEPTRGIDIGAKADIYHWIHKLASEGMAIILVSSEMPELLGLCHRILVLKEGKPQAVFESNAFSQEAILKAAAL